MTLSGGALLQGLVLDGFPVVEILEVMDSVKGEVRVERRVMGGIRREVNVLLEDGRVRGAERPDGTPGREWEKGILEIVGYLQAEGWHPESILLLGGGGGTLSRFLSQGSSRARVHVVERSPEVVTMARAHFLEWDGWGEVGLEIRELIPSDGRASEAYSLTVVDCGALPGLGGVPALRDGDWRFLRETVAPRGVLVLGGIGFREGKGGSGIDDLAAGGVAWFDDVLTYLWRSSGEGAHLVVENARGEEGIVVFTTVGAPALPSSIGEFKQHSPARG